MMSRIQFITETNLKHVLPALDQHNFLSKLQIANIFALATDNQPSLKQGTGISIFNRLDFFSVNCTLNKEKWRNVNIEPGYDLSHYPNYELLE